MARRNLLAIDGGGIRGIIPICALIALEKKTHKLTREIFSFVAGTSTGAIITAAIAAGIPAERILDSYRRLAVQVFKKNLLTLPSRVFRGYMYPTTRLREAVAAQLVDASAWDLNRCPIDVLISAKRLSDGHAWYFVKDGASNRGRTGSLGLVDCVTGSAAAPTFFQPWLIREAPGTPDPVGTVVDGGVGVTGNPIYQACVEAFDYTEGYVREETTAVSLGTGRFPAKSPPSWIYPWLKWILGELMQSPGEQQTELVQRHFPKVQFYRMDPDVAKLIPGLTRDIPLDDVGSIDRLVTCGTQFAQSIDWDGVLSGTNPTFRISSSNTLWEQYRA